MTTKRTKTEPDEKLTALSLREAGFSALAISERTGVSVRTLYRWFSEHSVTKGTIKSELLEQAKAELLSYVKNDDAVRHEVARLIVDDLAHANALKQKMLEALELLKPSNIHEAALALRAAASYATSLKALSDTVRASLKLENSIPNHDPQELPELTIRELTTQEIDSIVNDNNDATETIDIELLNEENEVVETCGGGT